MTADVHACVHLRAEGVSVLLDLTAGRLPAVVHWGADLGEVSLVDALSLIGAGVHPVTPNLVDEPVRVALLPESWTGWAGRPGISGSRGGRNWSPAFTTTALRVDGETVAAGGAEAVLVDAGCALVEVEAADEIARLGLLLRIEVLHGGVLRSQARLTNLSGEAYALDELVLAYPVPPVARELLDLSGRWGRERSPQRRDFSVGVHLREGRKGRTGPDAATVLHAGTPGFSFAGGQVWGVHTGWSGTTSTTPNVCPRGNRSSAVASCCCPGRWSWARGSPTPPRGSTAPSAPGWTPSPGGSTGTCGRGPNTPGRRDR